MTHEAVLAGLRDRWRADVLALYVHGSLIAGDFAPARSDLDVLAVLTADPDDRLLGVLAGLHAELDAAHPEWAGRIEVEYVSLAALTDAAEGRHLIARVSPGEQLHLLPATRHRLVTWATVHRSGRPLLGPPAETLWPPYDAELVRAALLDHVRDWPDWVRGMTTPGAQSYSVLTMCRAVQRVRFGHQLSKRQAAAPTAAAFPEWAGLIEWARAWWYEGGQDTDPGRPADVCGFVEAVSAALLAGRQLVDSRWITVTPSRDPAQSGVDAQHEGMTPVISVRPAAA
ncbi:nucleotidyltransferase domain-containing protein [Paractinoplanes maris]|uniref:nucleotidyltransferase domain-containing protein n=1 Tax=Paractinoplanes maris TaxID=1734446 RepID=UPI0020212CF7|nr:nucleotidyltransferase domain-containing protein [Actinoplanes maris]